MTPCDLIWAAHAAGLDFFTQDGRLTLESPSGPPPQDLLSTIKVHKAAIVGCLEEFSGNATIRRGYSQRVAHLPALSPLELEEAESLAAELAASGGLGHFVMDLCARWPAIDPRDQLAAVTAWELANDLLACEEAT